MDAIVKYRIHSTRQFALVCQWCCNVDGKAVFEPFVYDKTGTYTYRIKEIVGDDPDIRYDSTVVTAIVGVTDDGKGALHASVKYRDAVNGIDEASGLPQIVNHTTVSTLMPKNWRDMVCACRYRIDGDVGAAGHVSCGPQGVAHGVTNKDNQ